MRKEFLNGLHCPYSGSPLKVTEIVGEDDVNIDYAIVRSEAGEFPVVEGILRLLVDDHAAPIVELIKRRKVRKALTLALDVPFQDKGGAIVNMALQLAHRRGIKGLASFVAFLKRRTCGLMTDGPSTFVETAKILGSKTWADWQINRFSAPNFVSVYPLLHLLKGSSRVLDFGSGLGHASFLISRILPDATIVCADYSLSALYLSKKFFLNRADFVCLDGDYPLPFESRSFSSVFSSDAMHFVTSKSALADEFCRILDGKGRVVLAHLHNKSSSVRSGRPLSPRGYGDMFAGMNRRVLPESYVVEQFMQSGQMDLTREWSDEELTLATGGLTLVASPDETVFGVHSGLWDQFIDAMANPIVNPRRGTAGLHAAARGLAVADMQQERGELFVAWPPLAHRLEPKNLRVEQPDTFKEFCRKFIVIEAPERFM